MQDLPPSHPFGACPVVRDGQRGWLFRLSAPHAMGASVVGEFNQWNPERNPMTRKNGVFEAFLPGLREYDTYKFAIRTASGNILYKADPYAFHSETPPGKCSKLYDLTHYVWQDQHWFSVCEARPLQDQPLHLYEVHLGSWRRTGDGEVLPYRTITQYLVPYVKSMGFTGVALMPLMEHPDPASLGYLPDSWFSPTSRFGVPADLMYLVDELHRAGVSVFMDFPTERFSDSEQGLSCFDGEPLFEAAGGDCAFSLANSRVREFLLTAAHFWLTEYHLDGLRLSHSGRPTPGEGKLHRAIVRMAQELTPARLVISDGRRSGAALTAAEDWVSHLVDAIPPSGTMGSFPRSVVLPAPPHSLLALDHSVLARRGGTLSNSMEGDFPAKMARARLLHLLLLCYPGKKLTFMSSEIGQDRAWNPEFSLDWHLLHYDPFSCQQAFFRDANVLYLSNPALWASDAPLESFSLLLRPAQTRSNLLVLRRDGNGATVYACFNFSNAAVRHLRIGVDRPGFYRVLLNSDGCCYGGQGRGSFGCWRSEDVPADGCPCSMQLEVPPLGGVLLAYDGPPDSVPVLISPC